MAKDFHVVLSEEVVRERNMENARQKNPPSLPLLETKVNRVNARLHQGAKKVVKLKNLNI